MKLDDLADDASHCAICGTRLPVDKYYGRRKFCSKPCQREDYSRLVKADLREEKARQGRKCRHCDGPISVEKNSKAVYCSTWCQNQHFYHNARRLYPGTCKICGDRFEGHNQGQIYCSPRCRAKAGVAVRAKKWKPKMICQHCGTPFKARPGGKHCSRKCRSAADAPKLGGYVQR